MVKKLRDTQSENDFLKKKINEMNTNRQYSNPKDRKEEKIANFSTNDVHVLRKPLFSSLFIIENNNKMNDISKPNDTLSNELKELKYKLAVLETANHQMNQLKMNISNNTEDIKKNSEKIEKIKGKVISREIKRESNMFKSVSIFKPSKEYIIIIFLNL